MIDKERVIKGMEVCTDVHAGPVCRDCPYQDQMRCHYLLMDDALNLLKKQETEIRQLRLALDIAKGTCQGIVTTGW